MYRVCTYYLGDNRDSHGHECDFDDYNEAMSYYAYDIVINDSNTMGRNIVNRGYDFVDVSLWQIDSIALNNKRLAYWHKSFF